MYLTESNIKVGYNDGQLIVKAADDGSERRLPFASVDGISVFGMAQLSTQLIRECISSNVPIGYYSEDGHYYGKTSSFERIDPARQKRQIILTDDDVFCLAWSKRIVSAKIGNCLALLGSMRDIYDFDDDDLHGLNHSLRNLEYAETVDMVMGFEGNAAKCYFQCLPKLLLNEDFAFEGRSSRPPKDPFNAMLSYGYSLLHRNIIGAVERHGLHPYFTYMHKMKFGHAALASDLIEEYRAPLVDRTVLDLVNSGEVSIDGFECTEDGAIYMAKDTMRCLTNRLSGIIAKSQRYFLSYGDRKSYGFQVMLDKKIATVIEAIENQDASRYKPYIWEPDA